MRMNKTEVFVVTDRELGEIYQNTKDKYADLWFSMGWELCNKACEKEMLSKLNIDTSKPYSWMRPVGSHDVHVVGSVLA
jgi:hypothetical protein